MKDINRRVSRRPVESGALGSDAGSNSQGGHVSAHLPKNFHGREIVPHTACVYVHAQEQESKYGIVVSDVTVGVEVGIRQCNQTHRKSNLPASQAGRHLNYSGIRTNRVAASISEKQFNFVRWM